MTKQQSPSDFQCLKSPKLHLLRQKDNKFLLPVHDNHICRQEIHQRDFHLKQESPATFDNLFRTVTIFNINATITFIYGRKSLNSALATSLLRLRRMYFDWWKK